MQLGEKKANKDEAVSAKYCVCLLTCGSFGMIENRTRAVKFTANNHGL